MADQGMKCDLSGLLANAANQIGSLADLIREDGHPEDGDPAQGQPDYYAASLREAANRLTEQAGGERGLVALGVTACHLEAVRADARRAAEMLAAVPPGWDRVHSPIAVDIPLFGSLAGNAAVLCDEVERLMAFKQYVHHRLDAAGVPVDPDSPHRAEGCRIGGRLDAVFAERDKLRAEVAAAWRYVVRWRDSDLDSADEREASRDLCEWAKGNDWSQQGEPITQYLSRERDALSSRLEALTADRDRLAAFVLSLSARVHAQSELLGKAAARGNLAVRVADLERAVAPFAEILVTGWDDGSLPADALYPVRMGDLRQLARALAGTAPRAA